MCNAADNNAKAKDWFPEYKKPQYKQLNFLDLFLEEKKDYIPLTFDEYPHFDMMKWLGVDSWSIPCPYKTYSEFLEYMSKLPESSQNFRSLL